MTFEQAVDACLKEFPGTYRDWHENNIKCLVVLGVLKLDDLKPAEEYEQAIKAREIIEGLEIVHENTGLRR
jgi:hypothetical protein